LLDADDINAGFGSLFRARMLRSYLSSSAYFHRRYSAATAVAARKSACVCNIFTTGYLR